MTNLIATDSAGYDLDAIVEFYEIEVSPTTTLRYHGGVTNVLAAVEWYNYKSPYAGVSYVAMPIKMEGEERQAMGTPRRPALTVGTVATTFGADLQSAGLSGYDGLVGKKITKRTTLGKYIHDGGSDTGAGTAPVEFPKSTYLIENIVSLGAESIVFELANPFDTQGITIPHRKATGNLCAWLYQGARTSSVGGEYSACWWPTDGQWPRDGNTHAVFFNDQDEPIIPHHTSFTTYSSGAVTKDIFYKTTGPTNGMGRFNADGSVTNITITDYWQCVTTSSSPGVPTDTNINFRRVQIYTSYSSSTAYFAHRDSRYNPYVLNSGKMWRVASTCTGETPGFNAHWTLGDVCGKKINSCAIRYGFKPSGSGNNRPPTTGVDTNAVLPFGGFPGLGKKYLT